MIKHSLAVVTALLISTGLSAESSHHDEGHHQEAHVHGLAALTMALEGRRLELALESPAANIVGFEHQASTHEQRSAVGQAKAILESPNALFSFAGARCELKQANVDVSSVLSIDNDARVKNNHHEELDDHDDEGAHEHEAEHAAHSEITAHYHFDCAQGSKLNAITVTLLEKFPGIETLNAMWVTDTQQGAAKLSVQDKHIRLR